MQNLTAIIMAAGFGSRLGEHSQGLPKAIVEVGGRPLIWYAINLAKRIGANRIVFVGGWQYDKVRSVVLSIDSGIEVYENKHFEWGNLYTLEEALKHVDESFLLMHVDHVFSISLAEVIRRQLDERIVVFTDNDRKLGEDDMKVKTDASGTKLLEASKQLEDFSLGYVGLTYCHSSFLAAYKQAVQEAKQAYGEKAVTEKAMLALAKSVNSAVSIGDISGYGWLEIDVPEELMAAQKELSFNESKYI
ncbi:MAG: NTP transferase domain-containing protein [Patescibacteria group bacterium]